MQMKTCGVTHTTSTKSFRASLAAMALGVLMVGGCVSSPGISYVRPDEPVALFEFAYRSENGSFPPLFIDKVDGKGLWKGIIWRGSNRTSHSHAFQLTPGPHTFDVQMIPAKHGPGGVWGEKGRFEPISLTIELNALAGHNYRIRSYVYDVQTTTLYIEDIDTGEVVSGHRPEKTIP